MERTPNSREVILRVAQEKAEFWNRCNDLKTHLANIAIAVPEAYLANIVAELVDNAFKS